MHSLSAPFASQLTKRFQLQTKNYVTQFVSAGIDGSIMVWDTAFKETQRRKSVTQVSYSLVQPVPEACISLTSFVLFLIRAYLAVPAALLPHLRYDTTCAAALAAATAIRRCAGG